MMEITVWLYKPKGRGWFFDRKTPDGSLLLITPMLQLIVKPKED
jgi:hypothetical protein